MALLPAILGHTAADFFAGKNAWMTERIRKVVILDKVANVAMDVEIAFGEHPVSVNLTCGPRTPATARNSAPSS